MKLEFTTEELNNFIEKCQFTERQEEIIKLRNRGVYIVEISFKLNISIETVNRDIKKIKRKIFKVL